MKIPKKQANEIGGRKNSKKKKQHDAYPSREPNKSARASKQPTRAPNESTRAPKAARAHKRRAEPEETDVVMFAPREEASEEEHGFAHEIEPTQAIWPASR